MPGIHSLDPGDQVLGRAFDPPFYAFELTGRIFLALPPCDQTRSNDEFSAIVEPLLETIEGLADS